MAADGGREQCGDGPPLAGRQALIAPAGYEAEQDHETREDIGHDLAGNPGQAGAYRQSREQRHEPAVGQRHGSGAESQVHHERHEEALRQRNQPDRLRRCERYQQRAVHQGAIEEPRSVPVSDGDRVLDVVAGIRVGQREVIVERDDAGEERSRQEAPQPPVPEPGPIFGGSGPTWLTHVAAFRNPSCPPGNSARSAGGTRHRRERTGSGIYWTPTRTDPGRSAREV